MVLRRRRVHELDMINGPLLKNIIRFALPISLSSILQMLFNAADMAVVGQYAQDPNVSLAAIGSNGSLISILINLFMGFSIGTNIVIAKCIGENNKEKAIRAAHTSILLSVICGIIVSTIGIIFCRTFLEWLLVPDDVIEFSLLYMRIYFLGVPMTMLYNFGASILRAEGDTKTPLYFLTLAGIVNVVLNVILVKHFHMDVAGVAIATVVSQTISSILVFIKLLKTRTNICKIKFKRLKLHKEELIEIVKVGLPAGIHSSMYSIANLIIQSYVNAFGSVVMAANSAAFNLTNIAGTMNYGFSNASTTFTSQNFGAKNYKRFNKILLTTLLCILVASLVLSCAIMLFNDQLLSIFNNDPEVIEAGKHQLQFVATCLVFDGFVVCVGGMIRGLGRSFSSMVISIVGICGVRLAYLFIYFPTHKSLDALYIVYPISWVVTFIIDLIYYYFLQKKVVKKLKEEEKANDKSKNSDGEW